MPVNCRCKHIRKRTKNEPEHINIRSVTPDDIVQLVQLCSAHAHFERAEYSFQGKIDKLTASLFSNCPAFQCLVAEKDGHQIGCATFMKQFSTWDAELYMNMDCLFLTETARGCGIGKRLMKEIIEFARREGCSHVQCQTLAFNKRAVKFYDRLGATSKTKNRSSFHLV